jgi:hypothetical protein
MLLFFDNNNSELPDPLPAPVINTGSKITHVGYIAKLLNYIHSAFDKEPDKFTAFRVRHTSELFSWLVSKRVLTLYDNNGLLYSIDLSLYSLKTLVNYLSTLPDINIVYTDTDRRDISACALIEGEGFQNQSNGDLLSAYQSTLWLFLDAMATELSEAKDRIIAMLDQLSVKTADDYWLDEWGNYFGILRELNEIDQLYSTRIINEVIMPRGNNKAIEALLLNKYGQVSEVNNITLYTNPIPNYGGTYLHNGTYNHNAENKPLYGLFEIVIGHDLINSGSPPEFIKSVRDLIERIRDAGTHLDAVRLSTSALSDNYDNPPTDNGNGINSSPNKLFDGSWMFDGSVTFNGYNIIGSGSSLTITDQPHYNGLYTHNGQIYHGSKLTIGSIEGDYIAPADIEKPTVPTNIIVTVLSSTQINLSWTASTDNVGVIGYKIFRNNTQITTVPSNSYLDTGLTTSTTYTYSVSAYDAAGNNSSNSEIVSVNLPGTISLVSASNITQTSMDITWTVPEPSTGQVEYGTTTNYGQLSALDASFNYTTHTQHIPNLTPLTLYHFRAHSTNQAGIESISGDFTFTTSEAVSTDTVAPSVPTYLTITEILGPDTTPPTVPTNLIGTVI